jgi:uncharacterized membrane protein
MIDVATLLTIVLMALVTYLTRIGGYLWLRNASLGPRTAAVLEATPGCVLISLIAPNFVSSRPDHLLALGVTAATRLPLLWTVVVGVVSAGVLRQLVG